MGCGLGAAVQAPSNRLVPPLYADQPLPPPPHFYKCVLAPLSMHWLTVSPHLSPPQVMAGLWPLQAGEVTTPEKSKLFYLSQRPYLVSISIGSYIRQGTSC